MTVAASIRVGADAQDWTTAVQFLDVADDLLPIVADQSLTVRPDSKITGKLGKVPSRIARDGYVDGFGKWTEHHATEAEIAMWSADGRYAMGLQTRDVRALDIDIGDRALAQEAAEIFQDAIDVRLPARGRANSGKVLLVFRVSGMVRKQRLAAGKEQIELLGDGQQFVAAGTHPSGARYQWDTDSGGLPTFVPEICADQLAKGWKALAQRFGQVVDTSEMFSAPPTNLRFKSVLRGRFNDLHDAEEMLERHTYVQDKRSKRWAPPGATGDASVRPIPDRPGLWHSDHGSDPLEGTFDAWVAFVVLDHDSDLSAAEAAFSKELGDAACEGFTEEIEAGGEFANGARFKLLSAADLRALPPLVWRVRGVLPQHGFAAIFGPSGSGKSFLAIDLAAAIAEGSPWFDLRTKQAPVVYLALEGEGGMRARAAAWERYQDRMMPAALQFMIEPLRIVADAKALAKVLPAGAVTIVDTLNRAAPDADENSSAEMGRIIEAAKTLQRLTGGLVIVVHHTGKDAARGLRGHSSLFAALDGAIEVTRDDKGRAWSVAKSKDGADHEAHAFDLLQIDLGTDSDGEPVNSCVVVPTVRAREAPKLTGHKLTVFEIFQRLAIGSDDGHVSDAPWRQAFYATLPADTPQDTKRRTFNRAVKELQGCGRVVEAGGKYCEGF